MRSLILAVAAALAVGCSSVQPLAINSGERCFRCGRFIEDPRMAAEIIDEAGHALKFKSASCMAKYIADHGAHHWRGMWVTDYETGKFVKTSKASFVRIVVNTNTNERDFAAFGSSEVAAAKAKEVGGTPVDWETVLAGAQQP